jgi:hypothetical protein
MKKTTGWVIIAVALLLLALGAPGEGFAGAVWWIDLAEALLLAVGLLGAWAGNES